MLTHITLKEWSLCIKTASICAPNGNYCRGSAQSNGCCWGDIDCSLLLGANLHSQQRLSSCSFTAASDAFYRLLPLLNLLVQNGFLLFLPPPLRFPLSILLALLYLLQLFLQDGPVAVAAHPQSLTAGRRTKLLLSVHRKHSDSAAFLSRRWWGDDMIPSDSFYFTVVMIALDKPVGWMKCFSTWANS